MLEIHEDSHNYPDQAVCSRLPGSIPRGGPPVIVIVVTNRMFGGAQFAELTLLIRLAQNDEPFRLFVRLADAADQKAAEPENLHPQRGRPTPDETLTRSILPARPHARMGWRASAP